MTIYALLKGTGSTNTFHGITTVADAAMTWYAGDDENFYDTFEPCDDGSFHEVQAEPIVFFGDDEETA